MKKCKFSIITVCYNAEKYIEKTIDSVLRQSYENYEYIIKDGLSQDRTVMVAYEMTGQDKRVNILQQQDCGIYDAMNTAVALSTGEYVIFLNAGDAFVDENVLEHVMHYISSSNADIFYGDVFEKTGSVMQLRQYKNRNHKMWYYSLGACLCHQAMFCKRSLFLERLFDVDYKVCADKEWQMYHIKAGKKAEAMRFAIAIVMTEGFSSNHIKDLEEETARCVRQYCGKWYILYIILSEMKKCKAIRFIIQQAEKKLSCKN